jgi:predicted Zn-dependent peptidase
MVVDTAAVAHHGLEVLERVRGEIDSLLESGVREEEFLRAREQLKGNFILEREGIESHMSALGRGMLFYGRVRSEEEILSRIEAVTLADVEAIAHTLLGRAPAVAMIGPGSERRGIEKMLKGWA